MKKSNYIPIDWENLTERQQQQLNRQWAKSANSKLRQLEKRGGFVLDSPAYRHAKWFLNKLGNQRFSESMKLSGLELRKNLKMLEDFLNAETNTYRGYVHMAQRKLDIFEKRGYGTKGANATDFAMFLSSKEYKELRKRVASEQIIEDFLSANKTENYEEIMKSYQDFLTSELTFEQVEERRKKGDLIK